MFKVIIAGSRGFNDFNLLKEKCDLILRNKTTDIEIVSGGAYGADLLGEEYAKHRGYKIRRFIPDWKNLGKKAEILRNCEMGDYADALICFWDGESRGSKQMIEYAKSKGLKVRVIYYNKGE